MPLCSQHYIRRYLTSRGICNAFSHLLFNFQFIIIFVYFRFSAAIQISDLDLFVEK